MARPLRIQYPGAWYHVMNRGTNRCPIFLENQDRQHFYDVLWKSATLWKIQIHAYSLMPNHYHLLIEELEEGGVTRFMHKLGVGYAGYFNKKYDRSGALFQGKYKSILIERDAHFMYIPFYIHFNPLDMKFPEWRDRSIKDVRTAKKYLESYRWSSHLDYLGINSFPSVTQRDILLDLFGGDQNYIEETQKMLESFTVDMIFDLTLE